MEEKIKIIITKIDDLEERFRANIDVVITRNTESDFRNELRDLINKYSI